MNAHENEKKWIDPFIRQNGWLLAAGLTMLIYGLGEAGDSLYLLIVQAGLLPYIHLNWTFPEIGKLMDHQTIVLFPVFMFFAAGRFLAAVGVLRNRLWGFWLGIFISTITILSAIFFLPLGGLDMLLSLFVVVALLLGFLGNVPLVSEIHK